MIKGNFELSFPFWFSERESAGCGLKTPETISQKYKLVGIISNVKKKPCGLGAKISDHINKEVEVINV